MKRFGFLVSALGLAGATALPLNAQVFLAGVRAGANIASASSNADVSSRTGLVLGALAQIQLFGPLNFRAEAQYVQKGGKFVSESSSSGSTLGIPVDYDFNYLDIPLNLTLKLGSEDFFVYGTAGTTVGALLSATANYSVGDQRHSVDYASQLNSVDMSLDLGGGVGVGIAPHLAVIGDILYSFGLTDAAKTSDAQGTSSVFNTDSWKARNMKITAGLYFTL